MDEQMNKNTDTPTNQIRTESVDVLIVGGGPAGLAAAVQLYHRGIRSILIVEREKQLGGILRQCIHDGFGLTRFKTTLSGPEYAKRFIDEVNELQIPYITDAAVLEVTDTKLVTAATRDGLRQWKAGAVILTMGCRERTRGALGIPGERPAGVFTAGVAQAYINLYNIMPAREVVILGSGDIGMIMARRLTLEGAHVQAVFEIQPYPSGLPRNIEQCLNDYNIPLYLSHTVTAIHGNERLTGVTISRVDEHFKPIPGTEKEYSCDTLILSVGLIPENELSLDAGVALDGRTKGAVVDEYFQTNVPGIFAAGNVLHVHDLVDYVSEEAKRAGSHAAEYIHNWKEEAIKETWELEVEPQNGIRYTVPQTIRPEHMEEKLTLRFRVGAVYKDRYISVYCGSKRIFHKKKKKMAPGEMEQVTLQKSDLTAAPGLDKIIMKLEEA